MCSRFSRIALVLLAIGCARLGPSAVLASQPRITLIDVAVEPAELPRDGAFTVRARAETSGVALGSFILRTADDSREEDRLPGFPVHLNGKHYMADSGRIYLRDNGPLDGNPAPGAVELTVSTKDWPEGIRRFAFFASRRPAEGPFVADRHDFRVSVEQDRVTIKDLGRTRIGYASPVISRFSAEPRHVDPGHEVVVETAGMPARLTGVELRNTYYIAPEEAMPSFRYDAEKKQAFFAQPGEYTIDDNGTLDRDPEPEAISLVLDTSGWPAGVHHFLLSAIAPSGRAVDPQPLAIKVADPRDQLDVRIEDEWHFAPGTHFNRFVKLRDGSLLCAGKRSEDGGRTWRKTDGSFGNGGVELRDGRILGLDYRCLPEEGQPGWYVVRRTLSEDGGRSFQSDTARFHVPRAKAARGHAFHRGPLFMRSIIERKDGSLAALMAGWFDTDDIPCPYGRGRPYSRSYLCESNDRGKTWRYLVTLGYDEIGSEGYNEGAMQRLPDGNWLAVLRTGNAADIRCQDNPIMWTVSRDEGRTWSEPERTGLEGVFPGLAVLNDGRLAMSYGRPGAMVAFSDDGGRAWTDVTVVDATPSSGYTDVVELRRDVLLVGYGARDCIDRQTGDRSNQLRLAEVRYGAKQKAENP